MTGAQAMVQCLKQEGISVTFGYPGATIAPFYESLRESDIRHILTRGEQSAGHAASGYARITGRPGVCIATSGPGATNLLTAIATAYSDSIPMIAITGQVATYQLGRDVFQEVDTTGAAAPFTKYRYLVKSAEELGQVFKEAFHIANTGRKGPVLIDVPVDVQKQEVDFTYPESVSIRGYKPSVSGHPLQIRKVAEAIGKARRPVICCGGGVFLSDAQDAVQALCEKTGIPAVSTMMGIGVLAPEHSLYYGMVGQSGTRTANTAIRESDLLVLIGARVGDRAITRPDKIQTDKTIVHIDIDSAEIGKNIGTTIPLVGDATRVLSQLMEKDLSGDRTDWTARLDDLRREEVARRKDPLPGVHPGTFIRRLCDKLPDDAVYVADVGQNQIWSARNFRGKGRFFTTGGMGTMGYSLPAAVGAKLAAPQRPVVAVCGDGAFQMCMNELATMCQHHVPVKVIVMRNGKLGMVRELQAGAGTGEMAVDLTGSPNFGMIAEAYGIPHACLEDMAGLDEAIDRLLDKEESFVLECVVDQQEVSV